MLTKYITKQYLLSCLINGVVLLVSYLTESDYNMAIPIAIPIVAAALGAAGGAIASSGGSGGKKKGSSKWTKARLEELMGTDPQYQSSPYAANNLGLAQTLLNSRMAGAAGRERNIQTSGANTRSRILGGVTDSSQALSLMAGVQGQEGDQYNDLALQEGQDAMMKQQNLMGANEAMTAEGDKVHDDSVRRWQDQVNIAMTQYKLRTKRRADAAKVIGGIFTGGSSVLGAIGGGK